MRLKEKKNTSKFDAILKKFSAQGAKKVDYGNLVSLWAHLSLSDQITKDVNQACSDRFIPEQMVF